MDGICTTGIRAVTRITGFLTVLMLVSMHASASVDLGFESELENDGHLNATGTIHIEGAETNLVRLFIDSPNHSPQLGFMGTGDGDKNVTQDEVNDYVTKALDTGAIKNIFELDFVSVSIDGKGKVPTVGALHIRNATGEVVSQTPLDVVFSTEFKFDLGDADKHTIRLQVGLDNVSMTISFKTPRDYEISSVKGLTSKSVRNNKEMGSTVTGSTGGNENLVEIVIDKGNIICLLLIIITVVAVAAIAFLLYKRHERKKEKEGYHPIEYTAVNDQGQGTTPIPPASPPRHPLAPPPKEGSGQPKVRKAKKGRKPGPDERTFGKEYFEAMERDGATEFVELKEE